MSRATGPVSVFSWVDSKLQTDLSFILVDSFSAVWTNVYLERVLFKSGSAVSSRECQEHICIEGSLEGVPFRRLYTVGLGALIRRIFLPSLLRWNRKLVTSSFWVLMAKQISQLSSCTLRRLEPNQFMMMTMWCFQLQTSSCICGWPQPARARPSRLAF